MKKKVRLGLIPAAGRGNRLSDLPLTRILPKPMLPILNRPIIEYVVERFKKSGIRNIYITVSYKREVIKNYFLGGKDFGVNINYLESKKVPRGLAESIRLAEKVINEPFFVILGDDFTVDNGSLSQLEEIFWQRKAWVVTAAVKEKNKEALKRTNCLVIKKDGKLIKAIEKPARPVSNLRGCGIYLFHPVVFEYIKKTPLSARRVREITDTIDLLAKKGKAYVSILEGVNVNVNTLNDLREASFLLLGRKG